MKFAEPEAEFRNAWSANPDGSVGRYRTPGSVHDAIGAGVKKRDYSGIRIPVLALSESPPPTSLDQLGPDDPQPRNDEERAAQLAFGAATKAYIDRWVASLRHGVPGARSELSHPAAMRSAASTIPMIPVFMSAPLLV